MRKAVGIIGTFMLITAVSIVSPRYVAVASDNIVETQTLPELLSYEDFCKLYTCKEEIRVVDPKIIEVDQEDAVLLMKLAQSEAGPDDPMAIAYVMKVVINRLNDESFPNTISKVISQKGQFSVINGGKLGKTEPNINAHYALYLLESGQINIESKWFEADWVKNSWQQTHKTLEFEYGGHRYYK